MKKFKKREKILKKILKKDNENIKKREKILKKENMKKFKKRNEKEIITRIISFKYYFISRFERLISSDAHANINNNIIISTGAFIPPKDNERAIAAGSSSTFKL